MDGGSTPLEGSWSSSAWVYGSLLDGFWDSGETPEGGCRPAEKPTRDSQRLAQPKRKRQGANWAEHRIQITGCVCANRGDLDVVHTARSSASLNSKPIFGVCVISPSEVDLATRYCGSRQVAWRGWHDRRVIFSGFFLLSGSIPIS